MSAPRSLPGRPSLESLRKQAKRLARGAAADDADAVARVREQLPRQAGPLSLRDAQFVIAREYGFAGWAELITEIDKRIGRGPASAVSQARVAIHDQDYDRLRALLAEYPALVSWRDEHGKTLSASIAPYALDCSDPERERIYTRPVAAEMLIDAGMTVDCPTWEYIISTGAAGMMQLLARKNVLPRTLPVLAALGDEDAVRARLDRRGDQGEPEGDERTSINRALLNACRFRHVDVASLLLERSIGLDPELGHRIDRWQGRREFIDFLIAHPGSHGSSGPTETRETTPWQSFVIRQLTSAVDGNDLIAFRRWLHDERWVLQSAFVNVQVALIERASWGREKQGFITTLLDHDPALLRSDPPPPSAAIEFALAYGNARHVPLLTRIWPMPDDLPHAAGIGDAEAVARWFDAAGQPVLGSLARHYPANDPKRVDLGWGPVTTQQVLDVALAWSVLNRHFVIATFLLERGADIDTNWSTHEPASILHEAAIQENEDAVRFLIEHGADLTKQDYRYHANAEGWARYAAHNDRIADLLAAARQG